MTWTRHTPPTPGSTYTCDHAGCPARYSTDAGWKYQWDLPPGWAITSTEHPLAATLDIAIRHSWRTIGHHCPDHVTTLDRLAALLPRAEMDEGYENVDLLNRLVEDGWTFTAPQDTP